MTDGLDPTNGMDRTTLLLHRRTEGLPAQLPRPVDVRQRAERERRTRRATAGAVLAVAAVVTAVTVLTGGGPGQDKSEPVVTPTPLPTFAVSGPLALRVTPLMTAPDWEPLVGQPAERVEFDAENAIRRTVVGIGCGIDIPLAAVEPEVMGRYRVLDGSWLTEFLHPLDDVAQAEATFADIRDWLTSCHRNTAGGGGPGFDVTATSAVPELMQPAGPLDEVFVGKSTSGPAYQVAVARDDNIVVVLESTSAGFPAVKALETVLAHAIRGAAGRCTAVMAGDANACRPDARGVARRPYRLAVDAALDVAGWRAADILVVQVSDLPADTPGCLGPRQDWGAQRVWRSTVHAYRRDTTWLNEYVLDGGTADRAAIMFDALLEHWRTCRAGRSHPVPFISSDVQGTGLDDVFEDSGGGYSLAIARDENVVVLVEVTGYIDGSIHILRTALDQAITDH